MNDTDTEARLALAEAQGAVMRKAIRDLIDVIAEDYAPNHHEEDCPGDCVDHAAVMLIDAAWDAAEKADAGKAMLERLHAAERIDDEIELALEVENAALVKALKGILPFIKEDFPPGRDFPVTTGYALAYRDILDALSLAGVPEKKEGGA